MNLAELTNLMKMGEFSLPVRQSGAAADPTLRRERSLVYGQAGDQELLMDVFIPANDFNGKGIILLVSGGFFSSPKILELSEPLIEILTGRYGFGVFAVQHGSQPRFVISEIIPQITRAARFARQIAPHFDIDPNYLGALGLSSGGLLALMLGLRGDEGNQESSDPLERVSSRVQAVSAFFPPTDFCNFGAPRRLDLGTGLLKPLRESFVHCNHPIADERELAAILSPRSYITFQAAPTLLIHGAKDPLVPLQQSEIFRDTMRWSGGECNLIVKPDAGHGWANIEPELDAAAEWFDEKLGVARSLALTG